METIISTWSAMVSKIISHEERLNLKAYCPTFTNKLSNVETSQCHDTCCALLSIFANTTSCLKVKSLINVPMISLPMEMFWL